MLRLHRSRASSLATVTAVALLAASPSPAAAEVPQGAVVWGGTALELSMAGVFALNFGTDLVPNHGPGMIVNFTPLVIAPTVAFGARHVEPTAPLVVHGAAWLATDLFLVGTLIDGRGERRRMKVGTAAWTLGAAGAVAGGLLAATEVDPGTETAIFMGAPPAGFAAGGIVLGGLLVLIGGIDGDKAGSQFATGAIAGLSIGLGAATYFAYADTTAGARRTHRLPTAHVEPSRERILVSVGGSF
jgi:hypothetical protein